MLVSISYHVSCIVYSHYTVVYSLKCVGVAQEVYNVQSYISDLFCKIL